MTQHRGEYMSNKLFKSLAAATQNASAITLRANLIPASARPDDDNFFVLPPTYHKIGHLASAKREDGTHQYILIESPQSWANRLEELLDHPQVGVAPIQLSVAGRTLSINDLPHRIFDALLRDAEQGGKAFRETALGRSLTEARAENATAILECAPGTLLFGAWDSFAGNKTSCAKWPAALSGQIMGFDALQTQKAGVRIDPFNIAASAIAGFRAESRADVWTDDESRAKRDAKGNAVPLDASSGVGHGNIVVTESTKGAWVKRIELRSSLSITRLRRYHFPIKGKVTAEADAAARLYLVALGLWLMHKRVMAGLELRAGAELDATVAEYLVRAPLTNDVPLDCSATEVDQALQQALANAKQAGFRFRGPERFTAMAKLETLIAASEALSE